MLWELYDDIKSYIKMTFIPSMRNIFSSIRSLISMILVMLVLQVLLSVICIAGIENIKRQNETLDKFQADIEAVAVEGADVGDSAGSHALSDAFQTAKNGTFILIGALGLWALCSLAVYQRIASASADRDRYVWGMYVVHGAKKKKVRAMLKCELFAPHLVATLLGYPIALLLCNLLLGGEYRFSVIPIIIILLLSLICILLVVEYECLLIRNMTPTYMLREEDSPKSISYPRKHSTLVKGFTPSRYGRSSFSRMRKYYVSLSAVAAIPALLWICLLVSAKGETGFLKQDVEEFTIKSQIGLSEDDLGAIREKALEFSDKITSVGASASYDASGIHTHFLADKSKLSEDRYSPYFTTTYGDNLLTLTMNDTAFKHYTGYQTARVARGTVSIVYPSSKSDYAFEEGDRIFIAVSKLDGNVRVVDSNATELLKSDLTKEYDYVELDVAYVTRCAEESLSGSGFLNVKQTYFVLNDQDYLEITSIMNYSASVYEYEYTSAMDGKASFNITVPLSEIGELPEKGDCVELSGKYTAKLTLKNVSSVYFKEPTTLEKDINNTFRFAYINSVVSNGTTVTLNVTPQDTFSFKTPFGSLVARVGLGTPEMTTHDDVYFINTAGEDLIFSNGTVEIHDYITVHKSSRVSGAEAGFHAILPQQALNVTEGRLPLEELFANDDFIIAAADSNTQASLGIDAGNVEQGALTLVLPSSDKHYLNIAEGDELLLAITLEDVFGYDPNAESTESKYDILNSHVHNNQYDYVPLTVTKIIYSDSVERVHVFLSSKDFSRVIAKHGAYTTVTVSLDESTASEEYSVIRNWLGGFVSNDVRLTSVSSSGAYLDRLLRENADYSSVILLISILIPMIIPFIWYYPLSTLFDRRRSEIKVLEAIGKTRKQIYASFAVEGALLCACAFLTVPVLCGPVMLIYKLSCIFFRLPIEFEYSYLSLPILIVGGLAVALCAAICFLVCLAGTLPRKKTRKN